MTLKELAKQNKMYYEKNYEKLKKYITTFDNTKLEKYSREDLFDLGEVISSLIYLKVNYEYTEYLLNAEFDFTPPKHNFDAEDGYGFLEIKCRRKGLNSRMLENEPALLKLCKWKFAEPQLHKFNFKYINIFYDRIFIYDLNDMESNIRFNIQMKNYKSIFTKSYIGNEEIKFIPLHFKYSFPIIFSNTLKKELEGLFELITKIETVKQNKNKNYYKNNNGTG